MLFILLETILYCSVIGFVFYTIYEGRYRAPLGELYRNVLHRRKVISLQLASLFLISTILILKIIFVSHAKPDIGAEFITPTSLNNLGQQLTHDILNNYRPEYVSCLDRTDACFDDKQRSIAIGTDFYWSYINHGNPYEDGTEKFTKEIAEQKKKRLIENGFSPNESSLYRGRILHHYSTILYPYLASFRDGFETIITAQYGAISILPLYVIPNMNFNAYNACSYIIVLIFALGFSFTFLRARPRDVKSLTAVTLLFFSISVALNQGAIYIGIGFNALRYMPISLMIGINLFYPVRIWAGFAILILALLNSIQFNILYVLSAAFLIFIERFTLPTLSATMSRDKIVKSVSHVLAVICVIAVQLILNQNNAWNFPSALFGSLGDPSKIGNLTRFAYGLMILSFPLLALFMITKSAPLQQNLTIISAIIYCGTFSSYAFSFPGSPQHFVGYLLLTAPALFFLIRASAEESKIYSILVSAVFLFPIAYNRYVSPPAPIERPAFDIYETKAVGKPLIFHIANEANLIDVEIRALIPENTDLKDTYFLIREKHLLELNAQRAYYPSTYDAFANLEAIKPSQFPAYLTKFKWLVAYSPEYISELRRLLSHASGLTIEPLEDFRHRALLEKNEQLLENLKNRSKQCSLRYCVYALEPQSSP